MSRIPPYMPSKDEVYQQWEEAEQCEHNTRFWCEECCDRSWNSGERAGFESGLNIAIAYLSEMAGRMYVDHHTDKAQVYRDAADHLKQEKAKKAEERRKLKAG